MPAFLSIPPLAAERYIVHGFSTLPMGSMGLTHAADPDPSRTPLLRAVLVRHDDGKVDTCGGQPPERSSLLRFIFVTPNGLPSELFGAVAGAEPSKRGRGVANLLARIECEVMIGLGRRGHLRVIPPAR